MLLKNKLPLQYHPCLQRHSMLLKWKVERTKPEGSGIAGEDKDGMLQGSGVVYAKATEVWVWLVPKLPGNALYAALTAITG